MGLGNFIKQSLTNVVECDWCGEVIVDGRFRPSGSSSIDRNYGGAGLGFFEKLLLSGKNFCCKKCEVEYSKAHSE